ncbi:MAG: hypothetical protein NZ869_10595 [Thermoanaerobaculum sp.]|nr:hypothetical protein [Thermoanaerobaculum sp.]MDW7966928.1 hypothetical protein [Thermoanaerobaculum sp.]
MRRKSTTLLLLLLAAHPAAAALPCPPALVAEVPKVAKLRGLDHRWQPKCEFLPQTQLVERLTRKLAEELPLPPPLYLEVLQRLGFVPPTPKLYQRLLEFYSGQVLGYYEPHRDTMVVVDRPLPSQEGNGGVWVHELAHAAQERRYGLPTKLLAMRHNSDQQRTLSAVLEGEAMLVMLTLASTTPVSAEHLEKTAADMSEGAASLARSAQIPEFFVEDLVFPYSQGLATVLRAWQEEGWKGVDRLLAQPPACTAQLLYRAPCRHLGDGVLPPTPKGWEVLLKDTLGAWAMRFWLARGGDSAAAEHLAQAWDGDRLLLLRHQAAPQQWALCWKLRLRSTAHAQQAIQLLRQRLPTLLAGFSPGALPLLAYTVEGPTVTVWANWPTPPP